MHDSASAPPHAGGVRRGATAPPRGAVGAEPQAKNAKLPIKHALFPQHFPIKKGAFGRAGMALTRPQTGPGCTPGPQY
jgi:hypothetical protein